MKQCNRKALSAFTIAMAAVMVSGCTKRAGMNMVIESEPHGAETVYAKVNFFGYKVDANNLVAIEAAFRDFMDIHPEIEITYEGLKGQAYWDAFEKRDASGNLDDIFNVDHDLLVGLRAEGKLEDLSGLDTIDNYSALAKSQFTEEDGSVYFLPISIATYGLYVNLDLLEEQGLEPPANLTEFTEACDSFAAQGVTPIIINNFNAFRSLVVAKSLYTVYQQEDPVVEIQKFNDGRADLAETLRPGIEMVASMMERGWIDREEALVTAQTSDDLALFAEGERPFMISGGWASPRVAALEPDFTYAVYPLPVLDDDGVLVMELSTCISVNANSPHLEEARQFVEFLTHTDVMWEYCDSQSSYTPLEDNRVPSDPTIAPSVPSLASGKTVMGSDYKLNLPLDSALRECGIEMMKGMDVEGVMALLSELLAVQQ